MMYSQPPNLVNGFPQVWLWLYVRCKSGVSAITRCFRANDKLIINNMICVALFGINIKIDGVSEPLFEPSIYCLMCNVLRRFSERFYYQEVLNINDS